MEKNTKTQKHKNTLSVFRRCKNQKNTLSEIFNSNIWQCEKKYVLLQAERNYNMKRNLLTVLSTLLLLIDAIPLISQDE